ncbi:MAG: FAD-binding oxidoreductase [Candidatus Kapaibacteriales bacterium]
MILKKNYDEIEAYLLDASNFKGVTEAVYIPENANELKALVTKFNDEKTPFTISGARTGLTGGAIPTNGVVISLEQFDKIEFDNGLLKCGAGATWNAANKCAEQNGYFIGPNPTETNSSIGGNINTNASGSRTFAYGSIRDKVVTISAVMANGDFLEVRRGQFKEIDGNIKFQGLDKEYTIPINPLKWPSTKNATGYKLEKGGDLIDILIGSDGTLATVIGCEILCERKPDNVLGIVSFFDDNDKLLKFVNSLKNSVITYKPRLIEYFCNHSLDKLREYFPNIPNDEGAIWSEIEYSAENEDDLLIQLYELLSNLTPLADYTWSAMDDNGHEEIRKFRHKLPELVYEKLSTISKVKIGTDSAVPDEYFCAYFKLMKNGIEELGIEYVLFGHIGNSHLHLNMFPKTNEQVEIAKQFYNDLMNIALTKGGTVSAEHGIGKHKKEYFKMMFDEEDIQIMKEVKKTFDPLNLMGNGNLF